MILKLTVTFMGKEETITLPIQYNHYIQAALYRLLDPVYAAFLHQQGYAYKKRQFRLFSFSRLLGRYTMQPKEGTITFTGPVKLVVLTPLKPVTEGIFSSFLMGKEFRIADKTLISTAVEVDHPEVASGEIRVRTLSPIVCYSTMVRPDGRKFTYYFEPTEGEFARLVTGNLYKKKKAWEPDCPVVEKEFNFSIRPVNATRKRIIMYKGTVIKGSSGHFLLQGDPELIEFALNVGLGSKGAQGFGAIEMV
jgi:CRISPR-associated endoribonuclease Cas6